MLSNTELLFYILIIAAAVLATRACPFLLFPAPVELPTCKDIICIYFLFILLPSSRFRQ